MQKYDTILRRFIMLEEKKPNEEEKEVMRRLIQVQGVQAVKMRSKQHKTYLIGTIMGISVGALFSIAGFIITILGFTGSIEWFVEADHIKSKLANASPGVFFAFLGMIILWIYKPKTKSKFVWDSKKGRIEDIQTRCATSPCLEVI